MEITQVEAHLRTLKTHHSTLISRISGLETALSARAITYRSSLNRVTASQSRFLSALPAPIRANPAAATTAWKTEAEAIFEKKTQAQREHDALREGVVVWEEALAIVRGFEEGLKREMARVAGEQKGKAPAGQKRDKGRYSPRGFGSAGSEMVGSSAGFSSPATFLGRGGKFPSGSAGGAAQEKGELSRYTDSLIPNTDDTTTTAAAADPEQPFKPQHHHEDSSPPPTQQGQESLDARILTGITSVLHKLDLKVTHAEQKNWKLLVCCLAAEAQAFREAREVMVRKLGWQDPPGRSANESSTPSGGGGGVREIGTSDTEPELVPNINANNNHGDGDGDVDLSPPADLFGTSTIHDTDEPSQPVGLTSALGRNESRRGTGTDFVDRVMRRKDNAVTATLLAAEAVSPVSLRGEAFKTPPEEQDDDDDDEASAGGWGEIAAFSGGGGGGGDAGRIGSPGGFGVDMGIGMNMMDIGIEGLRESGGVELTPVRSSSAGMGEGLGFRDRERESGSVSVSPKTGSRRGSLGGGRAGAGMSGRKQQGMGGGVGGFLPMVGHRKRTSMAAQAGMRSVTGGGGLGEEGDGAGGWEREMEVFVGVLLKCYRLHCGKGIQRREYRLIWSQ